MDYSKLSDGEISVRLAYFLKPKYSAIIHPHESTGAQLSWNWFNTVQTTGYFPLRRSEELFPVMKKHRIGLYPSGKTVWQASHESGISVTHRNPLRAAAIVFLMMQDANNA
ncbi:phage protein NinX family protein [Cronobacter sakazakii]